MLIGNRWIKWILATFVITVMIASCAIIAGNYYTTPQNTYYVDAYSGNDEKGNGSIKMPWKSIQKAADELKPGDTCIIRSGVYRETIIPKESGTSEKPIVYKAHKGASVTITGTEPISGWTLHKDNIYVAAIDQSLEDENQVFIVTDKDANVLWEARWPNIKEYSFTGLKEGMAKTSGGSASTVIYDKFREPDGFWKGGMVWCRGGFGWLAQSVKILDYDAKTGTLKTDRFPTEVPSYGNDFYITGVLGALDMENEWFIDSEAKKIYLWAPGGRKPENIQIKQRDTTFDLSDKSYITIKDINIFASTVRMLNSNHCTLDSINARYIYHSSKSYAYIAENQMEKGILLQGNDNVIKNSTIAFSSGNLIKVAGDRNRIENNHIYNANYMGTYCANITMASGKENLISNNTLNGSGRYAVYWQGGNANLQYNHIFDYMWLSSDGGAVYCWGADLAGSRIHHNVIHDSHAYKLGEGIYLDNFTRNAIVHHNVVYNIDEAGLRINSPSNFHLIYNNTIEGFAFGHGNDFYGTRMANNIIFTFDLFNAPGTFISNNILSAKGVAFADRNKYDYRLTEGSVAIDAGIELPGIIAGNIVNKPDCGAYEYGGVDWKAGHDFSTQINPTFEKSEIPYVNLVFNSGFESGLDGWTKKDAESAVAVQVPENLPGLYRGLYYKLRLGSDRDGVEQHVTGLKPNTTYCLTGWLHADEGEEIELGVKDFSGTMHNGIKVTDTTYKEMKTIEFTTDSNATTAVIYLQKTSLGSGYVYADDIGLIEK